MSCNCNETTKQGKQYCQDCMPDEFHWLVPVSKEPDPFLMDRNHAYIDPNNIIYILSRDRLRAIKITTSEGNIDLSPYALKEELASKISELTTKLAEGLEGAKYFEGEGIRIDEDNVIHSTVNLAEVNQRLANLEQVDTSPYKAGTGIEITPDLTIKSTVDVSGLDSRVQDLEEQEDKDTKYTAGVGLQLNGTEFSVNPNDLPGTDQLVDINTRVTALENDTDADTKYTAGNGLTLTDTKFSIESEIYNNALADHAEVTQARGNLPNLDSRLDAMESKEAEDYRSLNNKIINFQNYGIKGVLASLSEIQSQYPNGTSSIFVANDNKHWYYWNGSSWEDGGAFNSYALGQNEVLSSNLDLRSIKLDFDLIENHDATLKAKYIDSSNGKAVDFGNNDTSNYTATDFIAIPLGTSTIEHGYGFTDVGPSGWVLYDANKTYISGGVRSVITVPNNARYVRFTNYDPTLARIANKVRFVSFPREQSKNSTLFNKTKTLTFDNVGKYVNVITKNGEVTTFTDNKYAISTDNEIPHGTTIIETTARYGGGIAGWVVKDSFDNVILKGQVSKFAVPSNAIKVSFTDYNTELTHENLTVAYISQATVNLNGLGNLQQNLRFVNNYYIDVTTGKYLAHSGNLYGATDFIAIPHGTESIVSNIDLLTYGTAGYALYDINKNYLFGERSTTIQLKDDATYIRLTDYNAVGKHNNKTITFKGASKNDNPFVNKKIGFLGDSITYGYDPIANNGSKMANPWPGQVGEMLGFEYYENKGVSSSVLSASFGRVDALTMSKYYVNLRDDLDFVFVMGGINDVWNKLPLGQFGDTEDTTIYGALDVLVKKLLTRYPSHTGTKIIFSNYCNWDQLPYIRQDMTWQDFLKAIDDVCGKYGIPVCNMSKEVGISAYSDTDYYYWNKQNGYHDAHPKQVTADVIAKYVANWLRNTYS